MSAAARRRRGSCRNAATLDTSRSGDTMTVMRALSSAWWTISADVRGRGKVVLVEQGAEVGRS